jgi:hypothetical protein
MRPVSVHLYNAIDGGPLASYPNKITMRMYNYTERAEGYCNSLVIFRGIEVMLSPAQLATVAFCVYITPTSTT